MSVYFLSSDNFEVKEGQLLYKNPRQEMTLIFFYSTNCPHCKPIMSLIKMLAVKLHGCKYALINVKENYSTINQSKETSTPITYVPVIFLYFGGRPFQKFNSKYSFENLRDFIVEASSNIKNSFSKQSPDLVVEKERPLFTTGTPYCDDESGVCYLDFSKAYGAGI